MSGKTVFERVTVACLMVLLTGCATLNRDSWKNQANQHIEKLRKRDVQVAVVDASGKPVSGAEIDIQQTHKAFPFGAAISAGLLRNARWQEEFKRHFNWAVLENESKWYSNERVRGRISYASADALLAWCDANAIPVRGHCVFWEAEGGPPSWLGALPTDEFRAAIEQRVNGAVTHFRGRFRSWDVDNEMLHGTFFTDRLGGEIRPWMFKQAKQLDPSVPLFTNDYNILSIDWKFTRVQTDDYVAQVRELLRQGAPIEGIGIQGHLWNEDILRHPEVIRQRLDKIATLGLPIWISEFDVADPDDRVRADKLELVYRTAFSHPAVQGIMMWVFWAGSPRGPNAALMNRDWTPNEEGRRFESLMAEWTTTAYVRTDARGQAQFRGFHGSYQAHIDGKQLQPADANFEVTAEPGTRVVTLNLQ